jgi:hypothetical protein
VLIFYLLYRDSKPGRIEVLKQSLDEKNTEAAVVTVELTEKLRVAEERFQNLQNDLDETMLSKQKEKEKDEGTGHFLMFAILNT